MPVNYIFSSYDRFDYATFRAYLCGNMISRVAATLDLAGSKIKIMPDQSGLKSVDLQTGQTLPIVTALHLLQATSLANYLLPPPTLFFSLRGAVAGGCFALNNSCSIHSVAPRNGCLQVIPIFPIAAPFPRLMAVTLARIREPIFRLLAV